jgi:hypothetical protein
VDYIGAVQSIVTSGGSNDSGIFETNLRDERFLPFEGAGDFTATIRKDYFPYFTQGKTITIAGLDLYDGQNVTKHHMVGDPAAATNGLSGQAQFTLSAGPDAAGPTASSQVFLIVRYRLDG